MCIYNFVEYITSLEYITIDTYLNPRTLCHLPPTFMYLVEQLMYNTSYYIYTYNIHMIYSVIVIDFIN